MQWKISIALLVLFAASVNAIALDKIDANSSYWAAPGNVSGDVNAVYSGSLAGRPAYLELIFTPKKNASYFIQHRVTAYRTIDYKNCYWYDTVRIFDQDANKPAVEKVFSTLDFCNNTPFYNSGWLLSQADWHYSIETVGEAPSVELTADKTKGEIPLSIEFTGSCESLNGIKSCTIDFGDGTVESFGKKTIHIYSEGGSFNARIYAVDGIGLANGKTIKIEAIDAENEGIELIEMNSGIDSGISSYFTVKCRGSGNVKATVLNPENKIAWQQDIECNSPALLPALNELGIYRITAFMEECRFECRAEKQFAVGSSTAKEKIDPLLIVLIMAVLAISLIVLDFLQKEGAGRKK